MITAKLLLWDYQTLTKKGHPIKILVTKDRKKKPVHLKRYSFPEHWNKEKEEPKPRHPDKDLAFFVADKKREIIKTANYCNDHDLTLNQAVEVFKTGLEKQKPIKLSLIEFYDKRIAELKEEGKSTSIYATVRDRVDEFGDVQLMEIDYLWVKDFARWRTTGGMSPNGLHSYLRNLRTVFYEAQRRGLTKPHVKPFHGNMPKLQRTQKKAVFEDDIKILEKGPIHPRAKIWLFQFYMAGMDLVDVARLRWEDLKNGRITYQRHKLRKSGAVIDLKVFPKAQAIIDELGTPDEDRIFSWIPDPVESPDAYRYYRRNHSRRYLEPLTTKPKPKKKHAREPLYKPLPLSRPITNKSARHSFRSIGRRKFIDGDLLRELMGHEGEGVEYIYQDRFTEDQRDRAHKRIINGNCSNN